LRCANSISTFFHRRQASTYCGVRTGYVASIFVQIPRDLAGESVRTALRFEFADVAIQFAGAIESCALGCDAASGNGVGASELDQLFARGAGVTVVFGVEGKVGAGERAVDSVGLVEGWDVRSNPLLLDESGQALRRSVGAVRYLDGLHADSAHGRSRRDRRRRSVPRLRRSEPHGRLDRRRRRRVYLLVTVGRPQAIRSEGASPNSRIAEES
jgi:hypothetical protein